MDQGEHDLHHAVLDPQGTFKAAVEGAPPYIQALYGIIKNSHDSNAVAPAVLKASIATNAAALTEHSRILADTTRTLETIATRVDQVQQSQQSLTTRHDAEMAKVRALVSRNTAVNDEQ